MSAENPSCPQCQTELEDDFGIVDCKSCGAVCSVDLEGGVSLQGEVPAPVEEYLEEEPEEETEFEEAVESDGDSLEEEYVDGEDFSLEDDEYEEQPQQDEAVSEEYLEEVEPQEEEVIASTPASPMAGAAFLKDLEVFTEESGSDDFDHVYYDFHVEGLDSKKIKDLFIENASDSRLELSEEYLESLMDEGSSCTVPRISFLRLQVLYKRVMLLGLELSWSLSKVQQPVVHEIEEEEGSFEEQETDYYEDDEG